MAELRLTDAAQADIVEILSWSHTQHGEAARRRYERLILAGLLDISAEPDRLGSVDRSELGVGARTWHLSLSRRRARAADGEVRRPRHFLVYRMDGSRVTVGRVLHDAMELERHIRALPVWD